ncbi:hypothetical protein SPSYN_00583 [Sporotomaculum syntrophicum]|uniref:Nal1 N-terminal domain-containing protein n=1 Tax=Sporotomaculum syntrophicum TaxID=182264 RepID=A0A9D2WR08_9FIRM|nr:hypothetical protein [Sporotomaculum syntrophicum]KAF1085854.1 hypothetical protein SPSYN_00583 [Sporotomaculum syntrophicum]
MERHYRVLDKVQSRILRMPNVVGVGVGYKQVGLTRTEKPAIIVFVEKKLPAAELSRSKKLPKKINGLETDVIEIGRVKLLERNMKMRPALPGSSIGHYKISAGTFGVIVKDKKSGEKLILSNNHILANGSNGSDGRANLGDAILQPGPYDGGRQSDKIAELVRFVPLIRAAEPSDCPVAAGIANIGNWFIKLVRPAYEMRFYKYSSTTNIVDCAVAKPINDELIGEDIVELGAVSGVGVVQENMWVQKSGRTTGVTSGHVTAMGVTLKVSLSDEESGWFSDQVVADLFCQPGDSGSLIIDKENKAVGLLFAGSNSHCIFNRIQNVINLLEIEL